MNKLIYYLKSIFKKRIHYLNSAPVSCSDLWLWLCLTLSCLVLTYLNLRARALMLLIGQFFFIFVLIEGVSTRFDWNNYKWNFKLNMLRLMVSIPIYMSIYGTILLIQEMIFIVPTDLSDTIIVLFNRLWRLKSALAWVSDWLSLRAKGKVLRTFGVPCRSCEASCSNQVP